MKGGKLSIYKNKIKTEPFIYPIFLAAKFLKACLLWLKSQEIKSYVILSVITATLL